MTHMVEHVCNMLKDLCLILSIGNKNIASRFLSILLQS
jgi:hypothetical protein